MKLGASSQQSKYVVKCGALMSDLMSARTFITLFILILASSCSDPGLKQSAEADFRITLNTGSVSKFTDAELDSLENSKPRYCGNYAENKFYDLLVKKGIASKDGLLDTSSLDFHFLNYTSPRFHLSLSGIDFTSDTDDLTGRQILEIKTPTKKSTIEFEQTLGLERWVSVNDVDDDGKENIIILEKYYIVGGYNFDLKLYKL